MAHCDLHGIDFRTCFFDGTKLFQTCLQCCNFEGVDLSSAYVLNTNLSGIVVSDSTKFPAGFMLPADATNADASRKLAAETWRRNSRIMLFVLAIAVIAALGVGLVFIVNDLPSRLSASQNSTISNRGANVATTGSDSNPFNAVVPTETLAARTTLGAPNAAANMVTLTEANTKVEFVGVHVGDRPDPRKGGFSKLTGTATLDAGSLKSVTVEFATDSLTTELPPLTAHLKSPDFFDVKQHPTAKFESTAIEAGADGKVNVTGNLTLLGVTKRITMPATVSTEGGLKLAAEFSIDRTEFGMNFGEDKVEKIVAMTVTISIDRTFVPGIPPASRNDPLSLETTDDTLGFSSLSIKKTRDGNRHYGERRYGDAVDAFEKAIAADTKNPTPKNNLARLLATCPDADFRDGTRAVRIAMEANRESTEADWELMCVAAAAYAETGDFTSALHWVQKARRVGTADSAVIDSMLAQFRNRQPCRW